MSSTALSTTPAYTGDFPDPSIVQVVGSSTPYYAFATGDARTHLRLMPSVDGVSWQGPPTDPLPQLPSWASGATGQTWAPSVIAWGPSNYLLYYTTQVADGLPYGGRHCIGIASATTPAGPYTDHSAKPFLCTDGGAIDPSPFRDSNGFLYLLWKGEPQYSWQTPTIWSQQLSPASPTGSLTPPRLINSRHALLKPTSSWQAGIVERPKPRSTDDLVA